MIKKIYDRDTGIIYDVGGSERKVLKLNDINPEITRVDTHLFIKLNDRNYNNTHVVIDAEILMEKYEEYDIEDIMLRICENNKNCTIQFKNLYTTKIIRVFGGRTTCLEISYPFQSTVNEILDTWYSYSMVNIENEDNDIGILCEEIGITVVILNIDSYGNVSIKPLMEGEL